MTWDSSQLKLVLPSSQSVISTANGSTSPITGEGSVILSNTLTLDTVLVVPSLEYNLLSLSQITSTLACTVTFWPSFYVFQDILTRKILGYGVRRGKLYYLELPENGGSKIRTPSKVIDFQTPQQKLQSLLSIPHLPNLEPRVFGCTVYVHIPKILRNKLDPCAKRCVFVGYSEFQKGYRFYDPQT